MYKSILFLILLFTTKQSLAQTSIKRIDSLISTEKAIHDIDSIINLLNTIKVESKSIGYKKGMISYYLIKGVNLFNRGQYAQTLQLTYEGEKLILGSADYTKISHFYALRGNSFAGLSYFEESKMNLLLAIKYAEMINNPNERYYNLGRIYKIMSSNFRENTKFKDQDSILFYAKKSYAEVLKISENSSRNFALIIPAVSIGRYFFDITHIDSAKYYFNIAIDLSNKYASSKYVFIAIMGMGHINFKENRFDVALKYYYEALSFAQKNKNINNIKTTYQALAQTYDKQGDDMRAKAFYKEYGNYADSLEKAKTETLTMPVKYILLDKEKLIEKDKQLYNLYLFFAAIIVIFSVIIGAVIYHNFIKSKKNNSALIQLNEQMALQNEYLQNTLYALEQSTDKNNRMMQVIAHDLRNPITAIIHLSNFLLTKNIHENEDLKIIKLIQTSGEDSLLFINEILQKERFEAELKKEKIALAQLLSYCVTQLQYSANLKNQKIILDSMPVNLFINRGDIWRVISNIITNAIKFSGANTAINVMLKMEDGFAIISIKDNGIGIPDDLKHQIFNINKENQRIGTSGEKSFGLGLSIAKQIITAHKGHIRFQNNKGNGTTFYIALPLA